MTYYEDAAGFVGAVVAYCLDKGIDPKRVTDAFANGCNGYAALDGDALFGSQKQAALGELLIMGHCVTDDTLHRFRSEIAISF